MIRPATLISIAAVCAVGYGMFQVKYQVMQLEDQLVHIKHEIAANRDSIRVLNAEWSLLNQPSRLEQLAKRYLDLTPVSNDKLAHLDTVPERPSETTPNAPAVASLPSPALHGTQVANLKVSAPR